MAKIKITESELMDIVRESVVSVLNENIQTRRNNAYQTALTNYQNAQKPWESLTPDEKKPWYLVNTGGYAGSAPKSEAEAKAAYETAQQAQINNAKTVLDRKTRRNGLQFQQELNNVTQQLNGIRNALGANEQEDYQSVLQRINALNQKGKDLEAANTNLKALYGKLNAQDQATAMTNAGNFRLAANKWYAYQKQLKAQQTAQPQTQTAQPVQQQTRPTTQLPGMTTV